MARKYDKDEFHFPRGVGGGQLDFVILPSGDGADYDVYVSPNGPRSSLRNLAKAMDRWHEMRDEGDPDHDDLQDLLMRAGWRASEMAVGPDWD